MEDVIGPAVKIAAEAPSSLDEEFDELWVVLIAVVTDDAELNVVVPEKTADIVGVKEVTAVN